MACVGVFAVVPVVVIPVTVIVIVMTTVRRFGIGGIRCRTITAQGNQKGQTNSEDKQA
jgi:hypothetical protein